MAATKSYTTPHPQHLRVLSLYWMTSVNPVEFVVDPLEAVTVMFDVPTGVPGSGGGVLLFPPPPPQAGTIRIIIASTVRAENRMAFRFPPANVQPIIRLNPSSHSAGR
jgi:hypothetical protein